MGMAASQARFLGLTARKTNVEYEGQQINQQRTTLANETANYYGQLLGMAVPTPPSSADFTKTVYTFQDGSLYNSITSLIAQQNGTYMVSYLSSYNDDFSIVTSSASSIVNAQPKNRKISTVSNFLQLTANKIAQTEYTFNIGKDTLRELGTGITTSKVAIGKDGQQHRLNDNYKFYDGDITLVPADYQKICEVIGKEPTREDFSMQGLVINYQQTQCYSGVKLTDQYHMGHMEHNLCKLIWGNNPDKSVTSSKGVTLTNNRANTYSLTKSGWETNAVDQTTLTLKDRLQKLYPDTYQQLVDLYVDVALYLSNHKYNSQGYDIYDYTLSNPNYNENEITPEKLQQRWEDFWTTVENLSPENIYNTKHAQWQELYDQYAGKYMNSQNYSDVYEITSSKFYDGDDEYLRSLSCGQLEELYDEECYWAERLQELDESDNGWYVRYVKNTTSGEYEPVFYNGDDLYEGITTENGDIISKVKAYEIGTRKVNQEVKQKPAKLEKDSTGRYINITIYDTDENGNLINPITYALTTNTLTDQDAYDDAMNQYEYDKYQYDQSIQQINDKIEIIQAQDKNLELRLKQLDTEQDAISTEMDAVQKVIEKNTESTFKTFG